MWAGLTNPPMASIQNPTGDSNEEENTSSRTEKMTPLRSQNRFLPPVLRVSYFLLLLLLLLAGGAATPPPLMDTAWLFW